MNRDVRLGQRMGGKNRNREVRLGDSGQEAKNRDVRQATEDGRHGKETKTN
jgi:hypothetical protein